MGKKCCELDTCGEIYASKFVAYTGSLVTDSYIDLPNCKASINDVFGEVDRLLKVLMDADGVAKTSLTTYNCGFSNISNLIAATTGAKANTSDTIIAMLRTMCDLQTRIATLESADIYSEVLPQDIQLLLLSKGVCLDVDPCNAATVTLKDLLTKIIYKLCP